MKYDRNSNGSNPYFIPLMCNAFASKSTKITFHIINVLLYIRKNGLNVYKHVSILHTYWHLI